MKKSSKSILLFFLGYTLVFIAICISYFLKFKITHYINQREIAHFIGFIGVTILFYIYLSIYVDKVFFKIINLVHIPIALLVFLTTSLNLKLMNVFVIKSLGIISIAYFLLVAMYFFYFMINVQHSKYKKNLIKNSATLSILIVVWWELFKQPMITVYGGPPRGYIQWAQVIIDLLGIFIATLILLKFKTDLLSEN